MENPKIELFTQSGRIVERKPIVPPLLFEKRNGLTNVNRLPINFNQAMILPKDANKIVSFHKSYEPLWTFLLKSDFTNFTRNESNIYVADENGIYKLEANKGACLDFMEFPEITFSLSSTSNETLFILRSTADTQSLISLDLNHLKINWEKNLMDDMMYTLMITNGEFLLFSYWPDKLVCWNAHTGEQIWMHSVKEIGRYEATDERKWKNGEIGNNFMMINNLAITGITGYKLAAFNLNNGELVWECALDHRSPNFSAYVDGKLYCLDSESYYIIDAITGRIEKRIDVTQDFEKNDIGFSLSSFTVTESYIYFTATRQAKVVALNKNSGEIEWIYEHNEPFIAAQAPLIQENKMYILDAEYNLLLFEQAK